MRRNENAANILNNSTLFIHRENEAYSSQAKRWIWELLNEVTQTPKDKYCMFSPIDYFSVFVHVGVNVGIGHGTANETMKEIGFEEEEVG